MKRIAWSWLVSLALGVAAALTMALDANQAPRSYDDLVKLFADFLTFERPPMKDGAPD